MPKKITSILAFKASTLTRGASDEIQAAGSNSVGLYRQYHAAVQRLLRLPGETTFTPDKLTLTLWSGSPWCTDRLLGRRDRLYTVYDDATEEAWRITELDYTLGTGEGDSLVVTAHPLWWHDLRARVFFYVRETGAAAGVPRPLAHQVPLTGLTLQEALADVIFAPEYGMPALFTLGTVEATIASDGVFVDANLSNYFELILSVCDQVRSTTDASGAPKNCEFEALYTPDGVNAGSYAFNFWEEVGLTSAERSGGVDPDSRPITEPGGPGPVTGPKGNSLQLSIREEGEDYFNRLVPFAGPEDERIGIAGLWFQAQSWAFSSPSWTLTLADDVIYAGGIYVGQPCYVQNGFTFVTGTVTASAFPNQITFTPDTPTTLINVVWIKIQIDLASGETADCPFVHLVAGHEDTYGVVERAIAFEEVSPYENLFEKIGGDPTFSSGATALANGLAVVGSPVLAQNTDTFRYSHGTAALKVTANTGEGVRTLALRIPKDETRRYFSVWLALSLESGRVRMELVNVLTGQTYPPKDGDFHAESSSNALLSISIDGAECVVEGTKIEIGGGVTHYDEWQVEIIAQQDATVAYLDALTVVQSAVHEPYRKGMGKRALYLAAAEYLLSVTRQDEPEYETEFFDVDHFDDAAGLNEAVVGSYCRVRALPTADGTAYAVDFTARVTELVEEEDPVLGRFTKRARVARRNLNVADRLAARQAQVPRLPERPLIPYEPVPQTDLDITAQAKTATYAYAAGAASAILGFTHVAYVASGTIRRAPITDPSATTNLVTPAGGCTQFAYYWDGAVEWFYYLHSSGGNVEIRRIHTDGTGDASVVATALTMDTARTGIAVRPTDGKILFVSSGRVNRCDLDGSGIEQIHNVGMRQVWWHSNPAKPNHWVALTTTDQLSIRQWVSGTTSGAVSTAAVSSYKDGCSPLDTSIPDPHSFRARFGTNLITFVEDDLTTSIHSKALNNNASYGVDIDYNTDTYYYSDDTVDHLYRSDLDADTNEVDLGAINNHNTLILIPKHTV